VAQDWTRSPADPRRSALAANPLPG
jgi:hypothetical protein